MHDGFYQALGVHDRPYYRCMCREGWVTFHIKCVGGQTERLLPSSGYPSLNEFGSQWEGFLCPKNQKIINISSLKEGFNKPTSALLHWIVAWTELCSVYSFFIQNTYAVIFSLGKYSFSVCATNSHRCC